MASEAHQSAKEPGANTEAGHSVDRLIFFTDAVVAIAITLLILPLVEIVTSEAHKSPSVLKFLSDNVSQLLAFGLSFLIIARLWIANHELLANTARSTVVLMWLDLAWVFTIVLMPLPTELTAVYPSSALTVGIYIGTYFVSMLLLAIMSWYLHRHPHLQKTAKPIGTDVVWGISSTAGAFLIALVLALVFPVITYYPLLILLLNGPLDRLVIPVLRRREAARKVTAKAM